MILRVTHDLVGAVRMIAAASKVLSPTAIHREKKRAATELVRRLKRVTPRGWTGKTRAGWVVGGGSRLVSVSNTVRSAYFLEEGTPAHGPASAARMFIPLTRAATGASRARLVYGRQYVLAKRVRGIKARKYLARESKTLGKEISANLRTALVRKKV